MYEVTRPKFRCTAREYGRLLALDYKNRVWEYLDGEWEPIDDIDADNVNWEEDDGSWR